MLHYIVFIDSCAFYPPQKDEKLAIDKLFALDEDGIIQLQIVEATDEEMQKAPSKLRDRVNSRIFALDKIGTQEERERLADIKRLLFPQGGILNDNEERDVRNLFCAKKYGCCIFVTVDKNHILTKASLIKEQFKMEVVTPTQCLEIVLNRMEWNKRHREKMEKLKNRAG